MAPTIEIIYEDEDVLAVNKPAGIVVHPDSHHVADTLIDKVLDIRPNIKGVGEDLERPGIVHRLDKDTSGVILIAKNQKAFDFLKKTFQEHKIIKKYITLVVGSLKKASDEINLPIGRSWKDPTKRVAEGKMRGKIREALTIYKTAKKFDDYTLLEVWPKTGRTHQIRSHMKAIGHPVVCDKLYAGGLMRCPFGLKRHFLHASSLEFMAPNSSRLKIEAEMPEDLQKVLKNLQ